ncbi:M23 family metallopeptidase [Catenulispora sp. NF23]|uniref:M23 family metallopeptidase n=1 Tax=Catenulispora pinistramenti TaxID=2705254 RepID=UPI001BAA3194|nr:peptidoglycan DD-metalloendopeptidase family protein [Catenulispora pinistramenti]MBS2535836.1 M23 family metallopeptidase [Catenulispora pinistramenti]
MGKHGSSQWDTDWEAAITPNGEDSLYGSSDGYQAVNEWSGVYEAQPQSGFYEQGAVYDYEAPAAPQQPVMDQSYYESVYAAYSAPQQQAPAAPVIPAQPQAPESSPMWDGPGWQDPYAQYRQPQQQYDQQHQQHQHPVQPPAQHQPQTQPHAQPQPHYGQQAYEAQQYGAQPQYEDHNFHHPDFDTGTFEAIYEAPGSTEAAYDLLPDGEGGYDAYDAHNGGGAYDAEGAYEGEYEDGEYAATGYTDDAEDYAGYGYDGYDGGSEDDGYAEGGDDAPLRTRSRSGGTPPPIPPTRPFGSKPARPAVSLSGRRTLHAFTSTPAAVVGVAAVAVAAVGGLRLPSSHTETAADAAAPATPANGLEQNLLQMRAASANLADRATRSEQRSELVQQQALEKQRLAEMSQKYFLPVQDYVLTAGFGQAGDRWVNLHTGQDFAVPVGTKVVAVTDGTVIESGWAGPYGYRIVVQHPDGSQTWYCHLSVMKVRSGKVAAGQIIALSGDTGNTTGPHLHLEYHPPGPADPGNGVPGASTAVDPMPFLRSHGLVP